MNIQRVFSPGEKPWKRWKCLSLLCPHPQLPTKRSDPDIYGKVKNQIWVSGARALGLPLFRAELGWGWALRQVHTDRKRTVLTPSVQIREKRQHRALGTLGAGTAQHKAWGPLNSTQLEVTSPLQGHHWHTVAWDGERTSGLGWTPWALCRDQPVIRPPVHSASPRFFLLSRSEGCTWELSREGQGLNISASQSPLPRARLQQETPYSLSWRLVFFLSVCLHNWHFFMQASLCSLHFLCLNRL